MLEPVEKDGRSSIVQIRIASASGNQFLKTQDEKDISGHILWGGTTGNDPRELKNRIHEDRSILYNEELWSDAYHTYEIVWTSNQIELRVDGKTFERKNIELPTNSAVSFNFVFFPFEVNGHTFF